MTSADRTGPDETRRVANAVFALLLVVALAGVNWWLGPRHELRWSHPVFLLPLGLALLGVWHWRVRRARPGASVEDRASITRYFVAALMLVVIAVGIRQVVLLGIQVWIRFGDHAADLEVERRILGIASSAVFIVIGNALPKILTPLAILPLHLAERVTAARRFVGTAFVLVGLAMATAFLWLPLDLARTLTLWMAGGSMATMLGAIIWMNAGPAGHES
jgi:hypothetical protein